MLTKSGKVFNTCCVELCWKVFNTFFIELCKVVRKHVLLGFVT